MTEKQNVTLDPLDAALQARAQGASEMPWLQLKVRHQIEWREQARQWLKAHPGGLLGRRPLRQGFVSALRTLATSRLWPVLGVLALIGVLAYAVLQLPAEALPAQARTLSLWTWLTAGIGLASLVIALVNLPRLRQFYG
jgi:hypothetical protein